MLPSACPRNAQDREELPEGGNCSRKSERQAKAGKR